MKLGLGSLVHGYNKRQFSSGTEFLASRLGSGPPSCGYEGIPRGVGNDPRGKSTRVLIGSRARALTAQRDRVPHTSLACRRSGTYETQIPRIPGL